MSKPDRYRNLIWLLVAMSAFVPGGHAQAQPAAATAGDACLAFKKGMSLGSSHSDPDKATGWGTACCRGTRIFVNNRFWVAQVGWRLPRCNEAGIVAIAAVRSDRVN